MWGLAVNHSKIKNYASIAIAEAVRILQRLNGNPAWFIPDPDRPGKYLQIAPD